MGGWNTPIEILFGPDYGALPCVGILGGSFGPSLEPITFNGVLYIVLASSDSTLPAGVYKSPDGGVTWSGPLDAAHAPGLNNAAPLFDGAHTLQVFYSTCTFIAGIRTELPVTMRPFNLSTETWGADDGFTAGNYNDCSYAINRPDGSILTFCSRLTFTGAVFLITYFEAIWKAGVWTAESSLMTNFPTTCVNQAHPGGVIDAAGNCYAMLPYEDALGTVSTIICQVIKPDNTLGAFQNLTAIAQLADGVGASSPLRASIFQNKIVIPLFASGRMSFLTSPLVTPNFTPSGVFADPDLSFAPTVAKGFNSSTDGTVAYIAYFDGTGLHDQFRVCQSTDLTTWTAETVNGIGNPSAIFNPIVWPLAVPGRLSLTFSEAFGLDVLLFATFFTSRPLAPPPAPAVNKLIIAGSPYPVSACRKRNDYDWCLFQEELALRKITFPPMCNIPEEYRCLLPWDDEFGAIPPQSRTFRPAESIVTPAPAAGDQIVLQMSMPRGYDGLMSGLFQLYTGTGFEQGSGDIIWRIQINQRYVKDLSNSTFTLGSPKLPLPLTEGQILLSGQTIRYIVNVPNLSGLIQVGNSRIVCSFIGFYWPRG